MSIAVTPLVFAEQGMNRDQNRAADVGKLLCKLCRRHGTNCIVLAQERQEVIEKCINTSNIRCRVVRDCNLDMMRLIA